MKIHPLSLCNNTKYDKISMDYDHLDKESENKIHSKIRKVVCGDVFGNVIEIGIGTGNNILYYPNTINSFTGIDVSSKMLDVVKKKYNLEKVNNDNNDNNNDNNDNNDNNNNDNNNKFRFSISLVQGDVGILQGIMDNYYDWYIATYVYCVLPQELITYGINQMCRVLKNGGHFKIVDIVISKDETLKQKQHLDEERLKQLYGLNLYNNTLSIIQNIKLKNKKITIKLTKVKYLHNDTFLLIEGVVFK